METEKMKQIDWKDYIIPVSRLQLRTSLECKRETSRRGDADVFILWNGKDSYTKRLVAMNDDGEIQMLGFPTGIVGDKEAIFNQRLPKSVFGKSFRNMTKAVDTCFNVGGSGLLNCHSLEGCGGHIVLKNESDEIVYYNIGEGLINQFKLIDLCGGEQAWEVSIFLASDNAKNLNTWENKYHGYTYESLFLEREIPEMKRSEDITHTACVFLGVDY